LENKIELYFALGGKAVRVVYPQRRAVWIFEGSGAARRFEANQTLSDPSVLPGFSVLISAIFEGI
jgi:hypothetical protein